MIYLVDGSVTLNWRVQVEADSEDEAREIVEDMKLSLEPCLDGSFNIDVEDAEILGCDDDWEIYEVEELEDN